MKEILLPIVFILQISFLPTFLIFTNGHPESEDTARYFYGYEVDFDDNGTVQGHAERRVGHQTKGNYFVALPKGEAHSNVQYIANHKGFQPVVRIATKDVNSQVSSHFSLGKDAGSILKAMESKTDESTPKELARTPNRLLTNEVLIQHPTRRGKIMIRKHKIGSRPAGKGGKKQVNKGTKLVSEDDVFNINDAAEEYFDEISEERINSSRIDFRENSSNTGFKNIPRHVKVEEVISNSRPKFGSRSRSLKSKVPEILISPTKPNASEPSSTTPTPKINIEIVSEQLYPKDVESDKNHKELDVSTEVNVLSSISVSYSTNEGSNVQESSTEYSPFVEDEQQTKYEKSFSKATTISEAFLAPIQAGLLLYSDDTNEQNGDEFEDNVLSDTIRNDQTVFNHVENSNKTLPNEVKEEHKELDEPVTEPEKTFVESYHSNPVVEIFEKTVDGNPSVKYTDQTYYYSTERHVDGERPDFVTAPKKPPVYPTLNKPNINSQKVNTYPTYMNSNMGLFPPPPPPIRPQVYQPKFKQPFTNFGNQNHIPMLPPPKPPPIISHSFYRRPGYMFYATHTQHRPLNSVDHENCFNCGFKFIRDDYLGPVPPMNDVPIWNMMNTRHQRQLNVEVAPRMEYGFKPLLRPSIEINDEGLPLVKSVS